MARTTKRHSPAKPIKGLLYHTGATQSYKDAVSSASVNLSMAYQATTLGIAMECLTEAIDAVNEAMMMVCAEVKLKHKLP